MNQAAATPPPSAWRLYCDGSASPNPGRMAIGLLLQEPGGTLHPFAQALPQRGCNNEAEWHALNSGLALALQYGVEELWVFSDSTVLVDQLCGGPHGAQRGGPPRQGGARETGVARLLSLEGESRLLLARFARIEIHWLPRHRNGAADALARKALGLAAKPGQPGQPKRRKRR